MRLEHRTLFGDSVSSASGEPTPSDLPDGPGSVGGWQHTRRGAATVDAQRARDRIVVVILAGTVPLLLTDPTAASIRGGRSERQTTVKSWKSVFRKIFATTDTPIRWPS